MLTSHDDYPTFLPVSVAFTKEGDAESVAADLPDRPISLNPNLVTADGLAMLDEALAHAREAYSAARGSEGVAADRTAMARATRELRYWAARRASAQLTQPERQDGFIQFGDRVSFDREDGRRQSYRIVGEDEADPAAGRVSYASPLARALLGRQVGDVVTVAGAEVEVISID